MNNKLPPLWLVVGLMMFPQIVETIYSPVLTQIATQFRVSDGQASQTLSVYFLAFAVGVVCWGRFCDLIGRRPAMLAGLLTYGAGTLLALLANRFEVLLLAWVISAFGAAVGSVVTQTMLRDCYQGSDLARVFSVMGIALSLSPVLGLLSGGQLASGFGYLGVFSGLLVLAVGLLLVTCWQLPETRPACTQRVALWPLACRMMKDGGLWRSAVLVALFNTMLFGYYSLAPFLCAGLGLSTGEFGYSGILLALATLLGSLLNKHLLGEGMAAVISDQTGLRAGAGCRAAGLGESGRSLVPVAHDGNRGGLWGGDPQCAEPGAVGLSRSGRQCWRLVRTWLLPAAQSGVGGGGRIAGSRPVAQWLRSIGADLLRASFHVKRQLPTKR